MLKLIRNKTFLIPAAILGFIGIVFFISTVFSQLGKPDLGNQLQGYWTMRESDYIASSSVMIDRSGNGNDAIIYNPHFVDNRQGVVSGAVDYTNDQTTEYLSLPNTVLDGATDFTIAFWAYGGESGEYIVSVSDGSNHNHLLMKGPTASGWHFYVWRRNSTYGDHVYQDLIETDSLKHTSLPSPLSVAEGGLIIAQEQDALGGGFASTQSFSGMISDIRVYKRGLTNEEMKILYGRSVLNYSGRGLVGHWKLDATDFIATTGLLTDYSPYSNHGSIDLALTPQFTTDRNGKIGGAISLNGTTDWVQLSVDPAINGAMSLSFWFYANDMGGDYLFDNRGPGSWWFIKDYSGGDCGLVDDNLCFEGRLIAQGSDWALNTWNHVVVTDDTSTAKMYVNGVLVDEGAGEVNQISSNLRIGTRYTNTNFFSGSVDDVRLYNRAISEEEVKKLYGSYDSKTTTGATQQGLVLDMPLKIKYTKDETPGSEVMTDRTPYSNDGQNYGANITADGAVFDGVNDYVDISGINNFASEMTFSMWIKPGQSLTSAMHALYGPAENGATVRLYRNSSWPDNQLGWLLYYEKNDLTTTAALPRRIYSINEWTHTVFSYDINGNYKVYINGDLDYSGQASDFANWHIPNSYIRLGALSTTAFPGVISNFLIYNRALSDDEVKTLYGRGRADAGIIFQVEN